MSIIKASFDKDCFSVHKIVKQEFLANTHTFEYDEDTTITELFRYLFNKSGLFFYEEIECTWDDEGKFIEKGRGRMEITDNMLLDLFYIVHNGESIGLWDTNVKMCKLFDYLGIKDEIELYYESTFGGEGSFNEVECEGIQFYFHSDEKNHWGRPHVHAINNENEITIDIESFEVLVGKFRKKRNERKAINCVKEHQLSFMKGWMDHSNGIRVNLGKYFDEMPAT